MRKPQPGYETYMNFLCKCATEFRLTQDHELGVKNVVLQQYRATAEIWMQYFTSSCLFVCTACSKHTDFTKPMYMGQIRYNQLPSLSLKVFHLLP